MFVIYDKDGQAQKLIVIANPKSDGGYNLIHLEILDFLIIPAQNSTDFYFNFIDAEYHVIFICKHSSWLYYVKIEENNNKFEINNRKM